MTQHALRQLSSSEATRLTPLGVHSGMDITIQNLDTNAYVFLGGEGVNPENFGYRIAPGAAFSVELPGQDELYAFTDSDGSYISVLKTGLETGN